MNVMPRKGETVIIRTYPLTAKHRFWPRVHVLFNEEGMQLGRAYCLWVVVDIANGCIVRSPLVESRMPRCNDMKSTIGAPITVRSLDKHGLEKTICPQFTDVDSQGCVRQTRWLDWCCDTLGYDVLKYAYIASFDINAHVDIMPSTTVTGNLCVQDNKFSFVASEQEKILFAIGGQLKPRMLLVNDK